MYTVALMTTLAITVNAPDGRRCRGRSSCGPCYSSCHSPCYSYAPSYGHGHCGYGGGHAYGAGYAMGVGIGYGAGGYSASYAQAPGETAEEFAFCAEKAKEMTPEVYSNFRNSVWLQMTNAQRKAMMDKEKKEKEVEKKKGGADGDATSSALLPAQITVSLPADAKLSFSEEPTQLAGAQRTFLSPPLRQGRAYTYDVKAEFVRDGKTVAVTKKVPVTAGKASLVSFNDMPQQSLASR